MKWAVAAKTFLVGEYSAIAAGSALIITSVPYFELSLSSKSILQGIDLQSPAGKLWSSSYPFGIKWNDPYHGIGGLGASSAQFIGVYLAQCHLNNEKPDRLQMLDRYYRYAWNKKGLKPSAYDVIAQTRNACVFINKQHNNIREYPWVFEDLSFFLVHTQRKLATHIHLQEFAMSADTVHLSQLADEVHRAFQTANSAHLIDLVNLYHEKLLDLRLVAAHSIELIAQLKQCSGIVAIKGCGAMGSDVLLVLAYKKNCQKIKGFIAEKKLKIIATESSLTKISGVNYFD